MSYESLKQLYSKTTSATIIAILLIAIYFTNDFLVDKQPIAALLYMAVLALGIYLCANKTSFHESIYTLITLVILGLFLRNSIPHYQNPLWFYKTLLKRIRIPDASSYLEKVISTPYLYVYLIGILLFLICSCAPQLCASKNTVTILKTLGAYSICATILHMFAVLFTQYENLENIIFFVVVISAFWSVFAKKPINSTDMTKTVLLVVEISIFILIYPKPYSIILENSQRIQNMAWYYSIGLCAICAICIISEQKMQDTMIGHIILGTNLLLLYEKINQISGHPLITLLFHIASLSLYSSADDLFELSRRYRNQRSRNLVYVCCYFMAFLYTAFILNQYAVSIALLCLGSYSFLLYNDELSGFRGTVYGTVLVGATPWIMLDVTLAYMGKIPSSLFTVILFTMMFWCTCSVVLSWKDSNNIKPLAFNKTDSELIIKGLSGIAYLLTAVVLFR